MATPSIYIILLNYNAYNDTSDCIASLEKITYPNAEIVVVDNASTDDSLSQLQKLYPQLTYIPSQENKGFSGGCNLGIQYALDNNADYVLLLNNDTEVEPDFLEYLVELAERNPKAGLVGGKIYFHHDKTKLWDAGGEINFYKGAGVRRGHNTTDLGKFETEEEVTFVTGCMMLIRTEVLIQVGLLPECYFFGVEEWDYSCLVKNAGFQLWYCPLSVIYHKVGGSHDDWDPSFYYNFLRSRILFMKRNASNTLYLFWLVKFFIYQHLIKVALNIDPKPRKIFSYVRIRAFKDQINKGSMTKEQFVDFKIALDSKFG